MWRDDLDYRLLVEVDTPATEFAARFNEEWLQKTKENLVGSIKDLVYEGKFIREFGRCACLPLCTHVICGNLSTVVRRAVSSSRMQPALCPLKPSEYHCN